MTRVILSVLGVVLGVFVVFKLLGWIIATVKFFLVVAILAFIVYVVVTLIAKAARD